MNLQTYLENICASIFAPRDTMSFSVSPSTGDWKRSVASVKSRLEFQTGCDSFLRQRDASEPRRFNRSHVSVTGYRVLGWRARAPSPVWARRNRYPSKPHFPCSLSQASVRDTNCVLQSQCSFTSYNFVYTSKYWDVWGINLNEIYHAVAARPCLRK